MLKEDQIKQKNYIFKCFFVKILTTMQFFILNLQDYKRKDFKILIMQITNFDFY